MKKIILFYLLLFLTSCITRTSSPDCVLPQEALSLMAPYKISDKIYFKSDFNNIDTIQIVNQEVTKCEVLISIRHLPEDEWMSTYIIPDIEKEEKMPQRLFSMSYYPAWDHVQYSLGYRNFHYHNEVNRPFGRYLEKIIINNYEITECHKLEHSYPKRIKQGNDIISVYWTKEYGLTAYESKNGEIWLITTHNYKKIGK